MGLQRLRQTAVPSGISNIVALAAGSRAQRCVARRWHSIWLGRQLLRTGNDPPGATKRAAIGAEHFTAWRLHKLERSSAGREQPGPKRHLEGGSEQCGGGGWRDLSQRCVADDGSVRAWATINIRNHATFRSQQRDRHCGGGPYSLALVTGAPRLSVLLGNPRTLDSVFKASFPSRSGHVLPARIQNSLTDASWMPFPSLPAMVARRRSQIPPQPARKDSIAWANGDDQILLSTAGCLRFSE